MLFTTHGVLVTTRLSISFGIFVALSGCGPPVPGGSTAGFFDWNSLIAYLASVKLSNTLRAVRTQGHLKILQQVHFDDSFWGSTARKLPDFNHSTQDRPLAATLGL
jgi:hypothetical protein